MPRQTESAETSPRGPRSQARNATAAMPTSRTPATAISSPELFPAPAPPRGVGVVGPPWLGARSDRSEANVKFGSMLGSTLGTGLPSGMVLGWPTPPHVGSKRTQPYVGK